ncbi:MAG: hypothetical protein ACRESR_05055 [Gammaproteobacteria bacterium]
MILLADVLFSFAVTVTSGAVAWGLVAGALFCAGLALFLRSGAGRKKVLSYRDGLLRYLIPKRPLAPLSRVPIFLRLRIKALLAMGGMTGLRLGWSLLIVVGADYLVAAFHYDSRSLPTATIALALIALVLAGLYRILQRSREGMNDYLRALPQRRRHTIRRDVAVVLLTGLLPLAAMIGSLLAVGVGWGWAIVVLAVAFLVLLAFLRWPTVSGGRWTVFLCIVTAGCWSGVVMAAVR